MTQQTRTGLIAFAVVFGLFLFVGGAVLAIAMSGGSDKTTSRDSKGTGERGKKGESDLSSPVSTGSKNDPVAYICGHRWWKKPPTKKQLDELVDKIISMNQGANAFVNRNAVFEPSHKPTYAVRSYPDSMYENLVIYADWDKRPSREQVLAVLDDKLDRKEYEYGAGR